MTIRQRIRKPLADARGSDRSRDREGVVASAGAHLSSQEIIMRKTLVRLPLQAVAILISLPLACLAQTQWDDSLLKPYVMDHRAATTSPADVSFLHDAPAGKDGFRS